MLLPSAEIANIAALHTYYWAYTSILIYEGLFCCYMKGAAQRRRSAAKHKTVQKPISTECQTQRQPETLKPETLKLETLKPETLKLETSFFYDRRFFPK